MHPAAPKAAHQMSQTGTTPAATVTHRHSPTMPASPSKIFQNTHPAPPNRSATPVTAVVFKMDSSPAIKQPFPTARTSKSSKIASFAANRAEIASRCRSIASLGAPNQLPASNLASSLIRWLPQLTRTSAEQESHISPSPLVSSLSSPSASSTETHPASVFPQFLGLQMLQDMSAVLHASAVDGKLV
jgi:hypothetical protein